MDHQLRRKRLAARLPDLGLDALLVTRRPNVRYLTGFTGSNGQVLLTAETTVFLTDGRYIEQARHEVPDLERTICEDGFPDAVASGCGDLDATAVGFESAGLSYQQWHDLSDRAPRLELAPVGDEVEQLRWVKDPEELAMLERAQAATDQAFEEILERLAVGVTEREISMELEQALRAAGADGIAFAPIVAFGENAAEPHHDPNHRGLDEGDIVKLDFGALVGGYHADMTRTVSFGEPAAEIRRIYDVVRRAQRAGIDAVHPGASGGDVDRAARTVIEEAGYGERYTHGLGHGVGLEIHEGPQLRKDGPDVLPPGAVVTVEPGIYVPGLGGVRIEDMVEVAEGGCRPLPAATKDLVVL